jgi:hypothetical protein
MRDPVTRRCLQYADRPFVQLHVARASDGFEQRDLITGELQHEGAGGSIQPDMVIIGAGYQVLAVAVRLRGRVFAFPQAGSDLAPQLVPRPVELLGLPQPVILLRRLEGSDLGVVAKAKLFPSPRQVKTACYPGVVPQRLVVQTRLADRLHVAILERLLTVN